MSQSRSKQAFVLIIMIAIVLGGAEAFKVYLITSHYQRPSTFGLIPIFFEYLAFSGIAFIAPWSWVFQGWRKAVVLGISALVFVLLYVALLSWMEWLVSTRSYHYWSGFTFTLQHSGLQVLLTFSIIYAALILLGVATSQSPQYLKRLTARQKDQYISVEVDAILYLESNDNYVMVMTQDVQKYLIRETIGNLESSLDPASFQRIHRKYIINTRKVVGWKTDPHGGYQITMADGSILKMSKGYKDKLKIITEKHR
ncbi:MAG: LytTR family transcriptional regulator DNA-binding domain-containing protein [Reichenbachiella sp.]|uniref:LytR/AlgR family response regulator transcription factor n=1 Tax=Reichenbachiella sp. TaxID=2184521 RepID=UPI0032656163